MLTCYDVAKYFLSLVNEEIGDLMSNLKLQKLVYYAQGVHLALYGTPLFLERIEAWTQGPFIPELHHVYKRYGSEAIPQPDSIDYSIYDQKTRELLNEVYSVFGQFSAWKLHNIIYEEPPWKNASNITGEITHKSMQQYFKTQLNEKN